ncbi:NADH-cytochrome b5 reductase [Savitreella phatthalungensis]
MDLPKGNGLDTVRDGIVIPAGLVIVGTLITKPEWLPYSVIAVLVLTFFKFYRGRTRKVLKKDMYQEFELVEKTPMSDNTALYRFALPGKNDILGLPIGQHITVACNIEGKEVARSYTPSSSDDDKGFFDLIVKSYPQGILSRYLGQMQLHQTIKVKGPKGKMHYRPGLVRAFGMIAGGTGITPCLQIIRAILKNPEDKTKISLIYANVTEGDIILRDELDALAKQYDNFKVYHVLNNPPKDWEGGEGFVTTDIIKLHCPAPADDIKILMCGPPPMMQAMKRATELLGYEKARAVSKLDDQVFCF